jgi:transposase
VNEVEARKLLIETYEEKGNLSETTREWQTSRHVVRKWLRRYEAEGEAGLQDRSRRPHNSPRQTAPEIEKGVMAAWEKTRYGPRRLACYLVRQGLELSLRTIRHISRRHRPPQERVRQKPLCPAQWAWDLEDRLMWLRAFGCETPVTFQTDWGHEFGGGIPERVSHLSERFLGPPDGRLARCPKGSNRSIGPLHHESWLVKVEGLVYTPGVGKGLVCSIGGARPVQPESGAAPLHLAVFRLRRNTAGGAPAVRGQRS